MAYYYDFGVDVAWLEIKLMVCVSLFSPWCTFLSHVICPQMMICRSCDANVHRECSLRYSESRQGECNGAKNWMLQILRTVHATELICDYEQCYVFLFPTHKRTRAKAGSKMADSWTPKRKIRKFKISLALAWNYGICSHAMRWRITGNMCNNSNAFINFVLISIYFKKYMAGW